MSPGDGWIDSTRLPESISEAYVTTRPPPPPFECSSGSGESMTTMCLSAGAESSRSLVLARIASLATMRALASQSRTMNSHSLGCWASYIGT
jgi:hypothetical protein